MNCDEQFVQDTYLQELRICTCTERVCKLIIPAHSVTRRQADICCTGVLSTTTLRPNQQEQKQ